MTLSLAGCSDRAEGRLKRAPESAKGVSDQNLANRQHCDKAQRTIYLFIPHKYFFQGDEPSLLVTVERFAIEL